MCSSDLRNLGSFRFDSSFQTWLYRIATNLCLDQLRKRKVRREEPAVLTTAEGTLDRTEGVPEERVEGDPQRNLFAGQVRRRVKEAMAQLGLCGRTVRAPISEVPEAERAEVAALLASLGLHAPVSA